MSNTILAYLFGYGIPFGVVIAMAVFSILALGLLIAYPKYGALVLFAAVLIFVNTSYGSNLEEPCGTTILEGLALGKPVYALARGGTIELKCYERWPGQLHLFADMTALAKGLMQPDSTVPDHVEDKPFGADIEILLPQFLRVYGL